ncbi:MAG: hypothetical protein ACRCSN_01995 [Dermatophilaceae bacterium]
MDSGRRVLVCGVRSETHLLHVASWVRHRGYTGPGTNLGIVEPRAFLGAARVDVDAARWYLPLPARVVADVPADVRWDELICVGSPAVRAWTDIVRRARRPPVVVVVDDGIGSYGSWRTRRAAAQREGATAAVAVLRGLARSASGPVLRAHRWPLYRHRGSGWQVEEAVAEEFRRALLSRAARSAGAPAVAPVAVYLSQPWPELGVLTPDQHAEHLVAVAAACDAVGLTLRVRPHPAEDLRRYDATRLEVVNTTGPAELDAGVVGAAVVLGSHSTALLNIAAVHGTPALRVAVRGLDALEAGLSRDQSALLTTFLGEPVRGDGSELTRRLHEVRR